MTEAATIGVAEWRSAFATAERWLAMNRDAVNAINVYPVPDGDTGTNMLLTWRAALHAPGPEATSAGEYLRAAARGALLGARGNSGVILSQMLRGLAESLEGADAVDYAWLARALDAASRVAYESVPDPVDGTMLTVMREAAAAASGEASRCGTVAAVLRAAVAEARASVERTPDLLPRLREAGVVDAGGLGIALLLEGVTSAVTGEDLPDPLPATAPVEMGSVAHEGHGYCTEYVVQGSGIDRDALTARLREAGGASILVVGDPHAVHVHVHTDDPGGALSCGSAFGRLASVKVEDMQAQHEAWVAAHEGGPPRAAAPAPRVGLVAVARGEGLAAAFRDLGAARVVSGEPGGKPSAGELLEAARTAGREQVMLLPNDKDVLMAAEAAARESAGLITVIPTRSVAAGLAAAVAYLPDGHPDEVAEAMRAAAGDVRCIEVTRAARDAKVDGIVVREGDAIAFLDGSLVAGARSPETALREALRAARAGEASLATVYLGREADAHAGERVTSLIAEGWPDLEVEIIEGGQPYYPYVVAIE